MAAPSFRSASSVAQSSTSTSMTLAAPTGIADDDILYIGVTLAASTATPTVTGFTVVTNQNTDYDGGTNVILRKVAASESGSYTVNWTGNSRGVGWMIAVSGADTTTPEAATPTPTYLASLNPNPPASGTVASGDYLGIAVASWEGKGTANVQPTNYTDRANITTSGGGSPTTHCGHCVTTQELTGITSENPGAFTLSNSDGAVANTILVAAPADPDTDANAESAAGTGTAYQATTTVDNIEAAAGSISATGTAYDTTVTTGTPGSTQKSFRFRTDDSQTLNADAGWAAAVNTDVSLPIDKRFRLRFELESTDEDTDGYQLQYRIGAGAWGAVGDDAHHFGPDALSRNEVAAVPSDQFADLAATTQVIGTGNFVAGDGCENPTSGTVAFTASNVTTELEWCLKIHKVSDQGHIADGSTIDFRMVRDDGVTLLDNYSVEPRLTVANLPGWIGGVVPEMGNNHGPFVDSNDNLYVLIEIGSSASSYFLTVMKSTDDGVSWVEVDRANNPTEGDQEGLAACWVTDTIHILFNPGDDTNVFYHSFRTSDHSTNPDTWGTVDQNIDNSVGTKSYSSEACSIVYRSGSSDFVLSYYGNTAGNPTTWIRSGVPGTWDTRIELDTEASTDFPTCVLVEGEAGVIHAVYQDTTNKILYTREISTADPVVAGSLGTRLQIATDVADGGSPSPAQSFAPPAYYDDAGEENIVVLWHSDVTNHVWVNNIIEGSLGTAKQASDATAQDGSDVGDHEGAWDNAIVADGTALTAFWIDRTDPSKLMKAESTDLGDFSTPTTFKDASVEAGPDEARVGGVGPGWSSVSAHIITRSGTKVIGILASYAGGGTGLQYYEIVLSATTDAAAQTIAATGSATGATTKIEPLAETFAATGTANSATTSIASSAEQISSSGVAYDATVDVLQGTDAETISGTGTANGATTLISPNAETISGSGTAYQAVAQTSVSTNVTPVGGLNYFDLDGVSDRIDTPDPANPAATDNLDVKVWAEPTDITPGLVGTLCGVYNTTGDNRCFWFVLNTDGTLELRVSADGTFANQTTVTSTASIDAAARGFRVFYDQTADTVDFETSTDISFGATWSALGTQGLTLTRNLYASSTANLMLGAYGSGTIGEFVGKLYQAEISYAGSVVADPDFTVATGSPVTDGQGNTWTATGATFVLGPGPIEASGTAYDATVDIPAGTSAPAETIAATGTANNPTVTLTGNADAETIAATGTAWDTSATRTGNADAEQIAATGTSWDAAPTTTGNTDATAEVASGTGVAEQAAARTEPESQTIAATGVSYAATATTSGNTSTTTEHIAATATSWDATAETSGATNALAESISSTGIAYDPTVARAGNPQAETISGTGFAYDVTATFTGNADAEHIAASGLARDAVADTTGNTNAFAGSASGIGTADQASARTEPESQTIAATGTAYNTTVTTSGNTNTVTETISATGTAYDPAVDISGATNATAEHIAATGTAYDPTVTSSGNTDALAETVSATGTAYDATVDTAANTNAFPEHISNTGTAYDPTVTVSDNIDVTGEIAAGTGTAYNATVTTSGNTDALSETIAATGVAYTATIDTSTISISGVGTGTGTAWDATVITSGNTDVFPQHITVTGAAWDAVAGETALSAPQIMMVS